MNELEQALGTLVRALDRMIRTAVREELSVAGRFQQSPHGNVEWLKNETVAKRLGVSAVTLAAWRASAKGPPFTKIGRLVRYRAADVDAWVEARVVGITRDRDAAGARPSPHSFPARDRRR